MARMNVRGIGTNYEVLGGDGPWVALSPGGRRGLEAVESMAGRIAGAGYRVVIHDRRNCGASDVAIGGPDSEYESWADDLHALLDRLGALPAFIGGASSGCRASILFHLRHREATRALLLWRVTGGRFAAERLAWNYYGLFIEAARNGGMEAVCRTEHFSGRSVQWPANRGRLMAMDPADFIDAMTHWQSYFLAGADQPVIGASEDDLRSIAVPTIVVPGCDRIHGIETGRAAHRLIPGAELYEMFTEQVDVDLYPLEEWDAREEELAGAFVDFLGRAA